MQLGTLFGGVYCLFGGAAPGFGSAVPGFGVGVPRLGGVIPGLGVTLPSLGEGVPTFGAALPSAGRKAPAFGAALPSLGGTVPSLGGASPRFSASPTAPVAKGAAPGSFRQGRVIPFAEGKGFKARVLEMFGDGFRALGRRAVVTGEAHRGEGMRAEADLVRISAGHQRRP